MMYRLKDDIGTTLVKKYNSVVDKYIIETKITNDKNSIDALALIDTGANCSCISSKLVNKLNLQPIDIVTISTPSSQAQVNVYVVDIGIDGNCKVLDVRVCDSNIGSQGLDLLIGTDILCMGDMIINNFNNVTELLFRIPSKGKVSF